MSGRDLRVALLTNFIPPYRLPFLEALAARVGALRVLVSTPMEHNREWQPEWGNVDVVVQRGVSVRRTWRAERFREAIEMHVPLDTVPRLRSFRPDVIVSGEMGARTVQAMMYGRMTGTPVHIWATLVEDLELGRSAARTMLRGRLLPRAAGVIVNGRSGRAYVERFEVPAERIHIIPQTTALDEFLALPLERPAETAHRLLTVGRVSQGKGIGPLLDALDDVAGRRPAQSIELVVIGDGPERSALQARRHPANLRVEWVGHVPYAELPAQYARSGVLVFPTLGDEWGLVVNEAFAAGMPVLGSTYGQAVQDLVVDGVTGWHMTPRDWRDIVPALERMLDTPSEGLVRMGSAARAAVRDLTPATIAERFAHVLVG